MISQDPMISMSATHEVPLKGSIIRGFYHVGGLSNQNRALGI